MDFSNVCKNTAITLKLNMKLIIERFLFILTIQWVFFFVLHLREDLWVYRMTRITPLFDRKFSNGYMQKNKWIFQCVCYSNSQTWPNTVPSIKWHFSLCLNSDLIKVHWRSFKVPPWRTLVKHRPNHFRDPNKKELIE